MADKEREQEDEPIGMVDGKLVEASDDYDDELDDEPKEEEPEPSTKDRARYRPRQRRIVIHGLS
jgi:hypothetical protein